MFYPEFRLTTTRPLLVKYLLDSRLLSHDVIGLKPTYLRNGEDELREIGRAHV